jgi:dynein heavy chain
MYLEPIFSSDDIRKKLPAEKAKFDAVDKNWRQTIDVFFKDPMIWEGIDSDKYKLEFEASNRLLDEIQKSLSEYLETKRR